MPNTRFWTWACLLLSGVAVAGSLWLSVGMDLLPCPLCYYQRTFAMGVFGVLVMSLVSRAQARVAPAVLAMPMALAGVFIAAWHNWLIISDRLECPAGIFGAGSAPLQSFILFCLIFLTLAWDTGAFIRGKVRENIDPPPPPERILAVAIAPLVLAALFAIGCIVSVPPPKPTEKPDQPLNTCRPPYKKPS